MSYKGVAALFKMVRMQIHMWMQNYYRRNKIGKFGNIVEIDESVFAH